MVSNRVTYMIPSSVSGYIQSNLTSLIDNLLNNKPPRKPHKNFCWLYSSLISPLRALEIYGMYEVSVPIVAVKLRAMFVARIDFKITVV